MYQNIPTKVLTGEVRLSYEHLSAPYANPNNPGAEPKYSVTMLIPKTDVATKTDIDNSMRAAYEAAVANDWKGARPQLRNALIYDGDGLRNDGSKFGPECAGHWVITGSTKRKPQVVDISNVNVELAPQDIYSGMYARVTLNFFAFNTNGNKGVGCGLGNVMKTRDGEPLAGGASAASDFDGIGQTAAAALATPNYGGAMPATPVQATYTNTGVAQQSITAPGVTPQINPITGLPM
jgi:hypothetical protein